MHAHTRRGTQPHAAVFIFTHDEFTSHGSQTGTQREDDKHNYLASVHTHTQTHPKKAHCAHTHTLSSTSCIMHSSLTTSNYLNSHNLRGFFFFTASSQEGHKVLRELFFPFSFANEAVAQAGDNEQERERKGKRAPAAVRICRGDLHTATLGSLHSVPRQFEASFAPSGPST